MSMFTVTGKVVHVFDQEGSINRETGEKGDDTVRLQMMGEMPVQGGASRFEMITVKVDNKKRYEDLKDKNIRLAVGAFSPQKGQIIYFIPKGAKPEVVA
jgi:hypothetical protein